MLIVSACSVMCVAVNLSLRIHLCHCSSRQSPFYLPLIPPALSLTRPGFLSCCHSAFPVLILLPALSKSPWHSLHLLLLIVLIVFAFLRGQVMISDSMLMIPLFLDLPPLNSLSDSLRLSLSSFTNSHWSLYSLVLRQGKVSIELCHLIKPTFSYLDVSLFPRATYLVLVGS